MRSVRALAAAFVVAVAAVPAQAGVLGNPGSNDSGPSVPNPLDSGAIGMPSAFGGAEAISQGPATASLPLPEPASTSLIAAALVSLALARRRRG